MSFLLIPVAPLSSSKSRLRDCFTRTQLEELTIAMFKDLCNTLSRVRDFEKLVYCISPEILEIAEEFGFIGIKEVKQEPPLSFDGVIERFNKLAVDKYNAESTVIAFLDLILITEQNFQDIHKLLKTSQVVVCPAIHSAGISILGRKPPDIIESCFSNPTIPSLFALFQRARKKGINDVVIYDSFRTSFDVDIKQDLALAYEYLSIFNLKHTHTYRFFKQNNKSFSVKKKDVNNNRDFKIIEK